LSGAIVRVTLLLPLSTPVMVAKPPGCPVPVQPPPPHSSLVNMAALAGVARAVPASTVAANINSFIYVSCTLVWRFGSFGWNLKDGGTTMSQRLRSIPDFASRKLVRFRAKAIGLRGTLVTLLAGTLVPSVKWNFSSISKMELEFHFGYLVGTF
jgi:hypothetical protein